MNMLPPASLPLADRFAWMAEFADKDGPCIWSPIFREAVAALRTPKDDGEPLDWIWILTIGGEQLEDSKDSRGQHWPTVKFGPFVWYTNLWSYDEAGTEATYFLKYQGACLLSSPEATRGQFRSLCAGLSVPLPT